MATGESGMARRGAGPGALLQVLAFFLASASGWGTPGTPVGVYGRGTTPGSFYSAWKFSYKRKRDIIW